MRGGVNVLQDTPQTAPSRSSQNPNGCLSRPEMIQVQPRGASSHIPDLFLGDFNPTHLCLHTTWKPGAAEGTRGAPDKLGGLLPGLLPARGDVSFPGRPKASPRQQTPGKWGPGSQDMKAQLEPGASRPELPGRVGGGGAGSGGQAILGSSVPTRGSASRDRI